MMKQRHAAALALIGWYLMVPPPYFQEYTTTLGLWRLKEEAPLSQWKMEGSYDSASECEQSKLENAKAVHASAREGHTAADAKRLLKELTDRTSLSKDVAMGLLAEGLDEGLCIASDDPRLKER